MKLTVLFFASLREALGCASEVLEVPAHVTTVGALRDWLAARGQAWSVLATQKNVRAALDHDMVALATPLHEGAEVAFFPPVTGG